MGWGLVGVHLLALGDAPRPEGRPRVAAPHAAESLPLITQASPMAEASELPTLAAARTIVHKGLAGTEPVHLAKVTPQVLGGCVPPAAPST